MLEFLSIDVPAQLQSCWNQIYCTTKRILTNNPIIISYWVHIRRDNFYRRLSRLKLNNTEDIWMKLLKRNDNISSNDIDQIYQFIRTSVHLVITDNYCTSPYYGQIKLNEEDRKTITITLSGRLLQSDSYSFLFVASAVLLRELTRTIRPECLIYKNAKRYLRNPLFFSWTGVPLNLWPYYLRKRERDLRHLSKPCYVTHPSDGYRSLVSDVGNLFQHIFYNGEVHLYDEFDERYEQVVTQLVIKTHDTSSAKCAARYLNDQFLNNFFDVQQCSLDTVRHINDQTCPYYPYVQTLNRPSSTIFYLVVTDTPITKRWSFIFNRYLSSRGPCYEYKPYHFYEPRQVYEQTYFSGHPGPQHYPKCGRFLGNYIRTDDRFFVENRSLFRRAEPLPAGIFWADDEIKDEVLITQPPKYFNDDLEDEISKQIKDESTIITGWRSWLSRIQNFINTLINKDIKCNTNKI